MSKTLTLALSICCLLAPGCKREMSLGGVEPSTEAPLSLKLLDGVVATHAPTQVGGQNVEVTIFPKNLGQSALFLSYYTLPSAAEDKNACNAAIDAEIDRCVANTGAAVLSRKAFPEAEHPTSEVVAKSPNKKSHSIRFRVICTGKEIQSLTAVTPDSQDAVHVQALDKMFGEFHAK